MNKIIIIILIFLITGCTTQVTGPASLSVVSPSYYSATVNGPRVGPIRGTSRSNLELLPYSDNKLEKLDNSLEIKPPPLEYGNKELLEWQASYLAGIIQKVNKQLSKPKNSK